MQRVFTETSLELIRVNRSCSVSVMLHCSRPSTVTILCGQQRCDRFAGVRVRLASSGERSKEFAVDRGGL